MAVHKLTTAVDALATRIVALEPLSIAEITSDVTAYNQWNYRAQKYPHWTNRPTSLTELERSTQKWQLGMTARLNLAVIEAGAVGTVTPQQQAWKYIPEVLMYFEAIQTTLAVGAYTEISYLAPEGITITCPAGMDYVFNPYTGLEALYIDFQISAPFSLMGM